MRILFHGMTKILIGRRHRAAEGSQGSTFTAFRDLSLREGQGLSRMHHIRTKFISNGLVWQMIGFWQHIGGILRRKDIWLLNEATS
jgi:hypothetical protein